MEVARHADTGVAQLEVVGVLLGVVLIASQHGGGELGDHLLTGKFVGPRLANHRIGSGGDRVLCLGGDGRNLGQKETK